MQYLTEALVKLKDDASCAIPESEINLKNTPEGTVDLIINKPPYKVPHKCYVKAYIF